MKEIRRTICLMITKAAYFYENESEIFHELRKIKSPLKGSIGLTREFTIRYDEKKEE